MENILIPLIAFISLLIIKSQILQKIEDKPRYPGVKLHHSKRGNLYTRFLRAVLPKTIK